MKSSALLALCIATAVASQPAARSDLTLNDGRVLKSARILTLGETHAHISHAAGLEMFPIDIVPLDALARAKMADEQRDNDPTRQSEEAVARRRAAAVDALQRQQLERMQLSQSTKRIVGEAREVYVKVLQVVPGVGFLVSGREAYAIVRETVRREYSVPDTGLASHKTKSVFRNDTTEHRSPAGLGEIFFVNASTEGLVDGDFRFVKVWRVGEYRYTAVSGAGSTIPRYTTSVREVIDLVARARGR